MGRRLIRVPSLPARVATKLEAFGDRGKNSLGDTDIEDVVCLMAYRTDLVEAILASRGPLLSYLLLEMRKLANLNDLEDVVSACFPPDRVSQSFVPRFVASVKALAG